MKNGWTLKRRQKQALAIKEWMPWKKSTGPKTSAGKDVAKMNAFQHGAYSAEFKELKDLIDQLN